MVLMIVVGALIAGIAFYQAIQGTFSALIMAILTILCSAIALNYYEPLAAMLASRLGAYAESVSLLALFALPLLILRELFDRFVRGNVMFGLWPDRIGGGALGLVAGLFLVGMLVIVVMMLPLPGTILGYTQYDATLRVAQGGPPHFAASTVLGTAKLLSAGSMQPFSDDEPRFGDAHSDLLLESFCNRNRPLGALTWAEADTLTVTDVFRVPAPGAAAIKANVPEREARMLHSAPKNPLLEIPGDISQETAQVVVVRAKIKEMPPQEANEWWYRLPATQFRLIDRTGKSYWPVDYLTHVGQWRLNAESDDNGFSKIGDLTVVRPWKKVGGPIQLTVDWVYRLPEGVEPEAMIFRRCSYITLPAMIDGFLETRHLAGALRVKAVRNNAKFAAPIDNRPHLVKPVEMKVEASISGVIGTTVKVPPTGRDPSILQFETTKQNSLKTLQAFGPLSAITRGKKGVFDFGSSGGRLVVQVACEVDKGVRLDARGQAELARFAPQLMLDDGRTITHSGAAMLHRGGSQIGIYYSNAVLSPYARRMPMQFTAKLRDNPGGITKLVLLFLVPKDASRSIVGLSMGVGPQQEFYAPQPMMTSR